MSTACRDREWACLCTQPKAWSCSQCPRCGVSRPDTDAIARVALTTRELAMALEEMDRLSLTYGRMQALQAILMKWGRG